MPIIGMNSTVILHHPLLNENDCIFALTQFETKEEFKQQLKTNPDLGETPCYFLKVKNIWDKISSVRQAAIDKKISHQYHQTADDSKEGRYLREEKGFRNPLIREAIQSYITTHHLSATFFEDTKKAANEDLLKKLEQLVDIQKRELALLEKHHGQEIEEYELRSKVHKLEFEDIKAQLDGTNKRLDRANKIKDEHKFRALAYQTELQSIKDRLEKAEEELKKQEIKTKS